MCSGVYRQPSLETVDNLIYPLIRLHECFPQGCGSHDITFFMEMMAPVSLYCGREAVFAGDDVL